MPFSGIFIFGKIWEILADNWTTRWQDHQPEGVEEPLGCKDTKCACNPNPWDEDGAIFEKFAGIMEYLSVQWTTLCMVKDSMMLTIILVLNARLEFRRFRFRFQIPIKGMQSVWRFLNENEWGLEEPRAEIQKVVFVFVFVFVFSNWREPGRMEDEEHDDGNDENPGEVAVSPLLTRATCGSRWGGLRADTGTYTWGECVRM